MWDEYAEYGSGFCLSFDITGGEDVKYVPKFTPLDCETLASSDFEKLVSTKSDRWQHEREIRVAKPYSIHVDSGGAQLYFHPFGNDVNLTGIILGEQLKLTIEERNQLTSRSQIPLELRKVFRDRVTGELKLAIQS